MSVKEFRKKQQKLMNRIYGVDKMVRTLKQERQFWIDKIKHHIDIKLSLSIWPEELEKLLLVILNEKR